MNRKPTIASVIFSVFVSLALMFSAVNTTRVYASAPSAKVTPPPTATPTATVTKTPVPTVTPVETVPSLSLLSDPTYIVPGGQVTIVYQITDYEKIKGTPALRFYAPDGFLPANPEEGKWDESTKMFYLPLAGNAGKLIWQADETITPPVTLSAELMQGDETLSKAEVLLDPMIEFTVEPVGGEANGINGKVQVTFPGGAVNETVKVKVTRPSEETLPVPSLSGAPFEITAVSDASKTEVSQFSKPVEIQIHYDEGGLSASEEETRVFWYDPSDGQWKPPLSQRVDTDANIIYVYTDHFTVFDTYNSNWQSAETPTMSAFQSPGFTGASSFSLPIKVPAGPGGFQPSLALSYNSQVVDSVTTESQAAWVGMGWSFDAGGYIERNGFGTYTQDDDSFSLNSNGMSGEIWIGTDGRYHLSDENFANIVYNANNTWTIQDKNGTTYYFDEVVGYTKVKNCTDPNQNENVQFTWRWMLSRVVNIYGTEIQYAYDRESQTLNVNQSGCQLVYDGTNAIYPKYVIYDHGRYRVRFTRIARYDYKPQWLTAFQSGDFRAFQRSLLKEIYVEQDANGDGTFETLIRKYVLTYASNPNDHIFPGYVWPSQQNYRTPTLLAVQEYGLGGTNSLPAYNFAYADGMHMTSASNGYGGTITYIYNGQTNYTLSPQSAWHDSDGGNRVKHEFTGSNSGWENAGYNPLPLGEVSGPFGQNGYIKIKGQVKNSTVSSFQPGRWYKIVAIMRASNTNPGHTIQFGYGYRLSGVTQPDILWGTTSLTNQWQTIETAPFFLDVNTTEITLKMNSVGYSDVDSYHLVPLPTYSRVSARTISSGTSSYTFTYDYDPNPVTNTTANSDELLTNHPRAKAHTEFRGHAWVTENDPYGKRVTTVYGQTDCLKGRATSVSTYNGAALYQVSTTTYACTETDSPAVLLDQEPPNVGVQFTALRYRWARTMSETQTTYAANGSTIAGTFTTNYTYDDTLGTPFYGNQITKTQSGDGVTLVTHTDFMHNTSNGLWLVGLPTSTWVTDAGGIKLTETINLYEDTQRPGVLTGTRTLIDSTLGRYSLGHFVRDAWGNVTSQTSYSDYWTALNPNPGGARTSYTTYDANYHTYAVSTTDALGHTTYVDYSNIAVAGTGYTGYTLGVPVCVTDPNGAVTIATYDTFGRFTSLAKPTSVVACSSNPTPALTVSYQNSPFVVTLNQVIDATHTFTMTRYYDGLGRQYQTNTNGVLVDSTFNAYGRAVIQSTPHTSGETAYNTVTTFDALGRPDLIAAPDGTQTDYFYDGLTTSVSTKVGGVVFNGHTTTTVTDILGRTKLVTPPTGPAVAFDYDALGNMTTATRGGVTTTLTYDNAGRKKTMTDPDMGFWQYEYDALGNMVWQIDARNCTTNFYDDLLGRPTQKTYSGCPVTSPVTYTYDDQSTNGIGRRHSVSDSSGLTTWAYDIRGRVTSEAKQIDSNQFVTSWTYNQADLPVSMTYPDGETINFTYDNNMMITSVAGLDTYLQSAAYDSAGRPTQRVLGNNIITSTFNYFAWNTANGAGRLQSAVHTNSTLTLQTFAYNYDSAGNITGISDALSGETQNFGYDALDRLTSASAAGGLGNYNESYTYNATTGNLETKGGLTLQYLDSSHAHAVTSAGGNSYQYDANGNQMTRIIGSDTFTLFYDAENRLTEVKKNNITLAQFTFDGDGRRVKSIIGSEAILFVGGHYEKQGTNVTKYYYAGAQRIAVRKSGTLSFLLSDHLGSTSITTDANGNRVSETRYKAWGEVRYTEGVLPTKYSFTGQYSNVEDFGLMYYGARWYDNVTGRFTQADTVLPPGPQGYDRYAYGNNSPIRYVDPSGHTAEESGGTPQEIDECEIIGTLCYFENMTWQERQDWLKNFVATNQLGHWFDDMIAAIGFMMSNPSLSQKGGTAEVMDVAVLQAVNDGFNLANDGLAFGGGGEGWADFFTELKSGSDENQLIATRLTAEQKGVDYAWGLSSTQAAFRGSSAKDQLFFGMFKMGADSYRSAAIAFRSNPLAVKTAEGINSDETRYLLKMTDPRTSGQGLVDMGMTTWTTFNSFWP